MRVLQASRRLQPHARALRGREQLAAVQKVAQAPTRQQLENQVRAVGVLPPVVHAHDVRVGEGGHRLCLGPEAAQEGLVLGQGGMEDLDRDATAQTHILGHEDVRRRARADGCDQPVAVAQDAPDVVGNTRQRHTTRVMGAPANVRDRGSTTQRGEASGMMARS